MFTAYALYISVMINGQEWEAIPQVFDSYEECVQEEKLYTKDIVVESNCFEGIFKKIEEWCRRILLKSALLIEGFLLPVRNVFDKRTNAIETN